MSQQFSIVVNQNDDPTYLSLFIGVLDYLKNLDFKGEVSLCRLLNEKKVGPCRLLNIGKYEKTDDPFANVKKLK